MSVEQYTEKLDGVAAMVNVLGQTDKVRQCCRFGMCMIRAKILEQCSLLLLLWWCAGSMALMLRLGMAWQQHAASACRCTRNRHNAWGTRLLHMRCVVNL
jgi:hypothetical protein